MSNQSGVGVPSAFPLCIAAWLLPLIATILLLSAPVQAACPTDRAVIDIAAASDRPTRVAQMHLVADCLRVAGKTIHLGPGVDLDFSTFPDAELPIQLGRNVTLVSVASFDRRFGLVSARAPNARGPIIRYGKHPARSGAGAFLEARCSGGLDGDGARISGFQLVGPSPGQQKTGEIGIHIMECENAEISNMEISGWGGAAIDIIDAQRGAQPAPPSQIRVLVHDNYLHNNQHPSDDNGHAAGYGVSTGLGAYSNIYQNVFDDDRHAVTASGTAGGYIAEHNLVLKGGGYHGAWYEKWIHVFDVHGTDNCHTLSNSAFNCGDAGNTFWITGNAFQFKKTEDIKIRGKPKNFVTIDNNVFARTDGAAIDRFEEDNTRIGANQYDTDSFGRYGVCDFDGDGVDDLFLPTGATWWFSSFGEFQWSYLRAATEPLDGVRTGYFDADARCDVLSERRDATGRIAQWGISSGGNTPWTLLGAFGHPLREVAFGRFDPRVRDHRANVTRQTTHAFWRSPAGQWFVTPLSHVDWQQVQSSSLPLSRLRFGDFTGDGVTDVLAVIDGHWAISDAARGQWRRLNATLGDPVEDLFIANMDADDNIDDILRLDRTERTTISGGIPTRTRTFAWWRSRNGTEPWAPWRTYTFVTSGADDIKRVPFMAGFAGRFGAAPGGGTMVIDDVRHGRFFSTAESAAGASPDWSSLFPY